jgi:[ribosomal protein S5]-alanine N-acetyltransferase
MRTGRSIVRVETVTDRAVVLTPRLRLRPFTLDDLPAHADLYADPEVTRWIADGPFLGAAARERSDRAVRRFVEHWRTHGFGVWAVEERESGRFLGQCGLNTLPGGQTRSHAPERRAAAPEIEILWALERGAWGRGLATEAARAALDHAFDVVGLDRVVALARPTNGRSRRIMEKLGMAWEKTVEAFGGPAVYYVIERRPRA